MLALRFSSMISRCFSLLFLAYMLKSGFLDFLVDVYEVLSLEDWEATEAPAVLGLASL